MEVKRKILALYEYDEKEKEQKMKEKNEEEAQETKEDMNETNQTFLKLKTKMKKILKELTSQEDMLDEINKKIKESGEMSGNGTWNAMKTRWEACVSNIMQGDCDTQGLDPFRRELSMFLQEAALLGAEDEVPDELLKKSQEYSDTGCEHIKESKELIKSMKAQQLD